MSFPAASSGHGIHEKNRALQPDISSPSKAARRMEPMKRIEVLQVAIWKNFSEMEEGIMPD